MLGVTKKEWVIELGNGHVARVLMLRCSQNAPRENDRVMVEARIELPGDIYGKLFYDLQFGDRVAIGGYALTEDWGFEGDGVRWTSRCFTHETAGEAFGEAERWSLDELEKLSVAVEKRRKAMLS